MQPVPFGAAEHGHSARLESEMKRSVAAKSSSVGIGGPLRDRTGLLLRPEGML